MDKIWDRKSFEVGGHWPLWRDEKNEWPRRTDKSRTLKKNREKVCVLPVYEFSRIIRLLDGGGGWSVHTKSTRFCATGTKLWPLDFNHLDKVFQASMIRENTQV